VDIFVLLFVVAISAAITIVTVVVFILTFFGLSSLLRTRAKMDEAQEEAERAENLMMHEDEIAARPARTWYQTESQKKEAREVSRVHVKDEQSKAQWGVGKAAELAKTAEQKARDLAARDDYRNSLEFKKGDHRLSRKKRRRLESLSALEDEQDGGGRDAPAMNDAPRNFKESKQEEAAKIKDKAAGDISVVWIRTCWIGEEVMWVQD
jgi:hypothetical protein